jgi:hypothetical protein
MVKFNVIFFVFFLSSCSNNENDNELSKQKEVLYLNGHINTIVDSIVASNDDTGFNSYKNGEIIGSIYYYDNQNINYEIIKKDSLILTQTDDSVICMELHILYDKNGFVIEKGCQGEYEGIGVQVGTWYRYQNNEIIQEIYYHNDKLGKDYILFKNLKSKDVYEEKVTNNFILYQTDSIILSKEEYQNRNK